MGLLLPAGFEGMALLAELSSIHCGRGRYRDPRLVWSRSEVAERMELLEEIVTSRIAFKSRSDFRELAIPTLEIALVRGRERPPPYRTD